MIEYIAHLLPDGKKQPLSSHCKNCADYASRAMCDIGLGSMAKLAGLSHDMGKYTQTFQAYLRSAVEGKPDVKRGSVNHTFAAPRYLLSVFHAMGSEDYWPSLCAELLAFATGAHHGLFDAVDPDRKSGFLHRQTKSGIAYDEAKKNFFADCIDEDGFALLFQQSAREIETFLTPLIEIDIEQSDGANIPFFEGLVARMLLSAVIEGDRRDTLEFNALRSFPFLLSEGKGEEVWTALLENVERKLNRRENSTPIDLARQTLSEECKAFANKPGGIIRLNLPTGAGKTLSSLRYALTHAKAHNKSRIIFTSPLLSILDQNAAVIHEYVQNDSLILEHHSNVISQSEEYGELDEKELIMESWDAPIIITTLVQFLYTLFDGKTSSVRRFHSLCNAVIVIDEVQSVPTKLLSLFNQALNFLSRCCKTTVILCSATQPCLEEAAHPIFKPIQDMVPVQPELWKVFRRTKLTDVGNKAFDELPELIRERMEKVDSLLVVCNKKEQAASLFKYCSWEDTTVFHLSAGMCTRHRKDTLTSLYASLQASKGNGKKTLCISTQVIEAGVDISFGAVIRLAAGMDNVVQAAGRCNRNGECPEIAEVSLVICQDEDLRKLNDIQTAKAATISLLEAFRHDPKTFTNDLASEESIRYYYRALYKKIDQGYQDDSVAFRGSTITLFDLLSENGTFADEDCPSANDYYLHQAFKTAGKLFSVFDNDTTDVLVPYGEGKTIIEDLNCVDPRWDLEKMLSLLEKAKPYTVSLYKWQKDALTAEGALFGICDDSVLCLQPNYYDQSLGLVTKPGALELLDY